VFKNFKTKRYAAHSREKIMKNWKRTFENELQMATEARERENEGQARVCARRAAGAVIREYFLRRNISVRAVNVMQYMQALLNIADIPSEARQAAQYLTMRVNEDFDLPVDVDLLEQTRLLRQSLLPGE
jgi:hypothetical protein